MGMESAYTLTEAREMLAMWKECERQLVSGQVKSYQIGSRSLTMFDIKEVRNQIRMYSNLIEQLMGKKRTRRAVVVVPRDL